MYYNYLKKIIFCICQVFLWITYRNFRKYYLLDLFFLLQKNLLKLFKEDYFLHLSGVFVNNLPELSEVLSSWLVFSSSEVCGFSSSSLALSIRIIIILVTCLFYERAWHAVNLRDMHFKNRKYAITQSHF